MAWAPSMSSASRSSARRMAMACSPPPHRVCNAWAKGGMGSRGSPAKTVITRTGMPARAVR